MFRLLNIFVPSPVASLLLSDIIILLASYSLPVFAIVPAGSMFFLDEHGLLRILLVSVAVLLSLYFLDLYSEIYISAVELASKISMALGVAFLSQAFLAYPMPNARLPIRLMVTGSTLCALGLFFWRRLYISYILRAIGPQRLLFVGSAPVLDQIADHISAHPELGLAVAGYVADDTPENDPRPFELLGPLSVLQSCAHSIAPWKIVVGMVDRRQRLPLGDLLDLWYAGFALEEANTTHEVLCGRLNLQALSPGSLVFSRVFSPSRVRFAAQRAIDVFMAFLACLLALPLMPAVALLVKLSSPGPILYRQRRVGRHGKLFTLFKFRSMYMDAEDKTGPVWASANDPRITGAGRIIRRLRLDELPQLLNVLRGDMSIVGPRPERPELVEQLAKDIPYYRLRLAVKPGITGWAQINHKYGDTLEDAVRKLEYDLYYIKHISLGLNAYIIFQTAKTMLLLRGAQ